MPPHQLREARVAVEAEAVLLHAPHEADRAETCAKGQAARGEQGGGKMQRRRQARRGQLHAAGEVQLQGFPLEQGFRRRADQAHQALQLGVGADQDVLAVVEGEATHLDAPGAAAEGARGFEHGDGNPACRQFRGGGHAGIARADDGDSHFRSRNQVRQAIHSLRSGVSAMRRSSTRQPSRRISASRAR